jgi:hypothetical protein
MVGSWMGKKGNRHAHSNQGLGSAVTKKKEGKTKDEYSCTRQEMAQTFCIIFYDGVI